MIRCDRCEYFYAHQPAERPGAMIVIGNTIYGGGQCRRHPPVQDESDCFTAKFPIVTSEWWCGEFVAQGDGVPA
jgi:hypothetical protein